MSTETSKIDRAAEGAKTAGSFLDSIEGQSRMPDTSHSEAMSMAQLVIDSKCGGKPEVLTDEEKAERVAALEELSRCDEALTASNMQRMNRAM